MFTYLFLDARKLEVLLLFIDYYYKYHHMRQNRSNW